MYRVQNCELSFSFLIFVNLKCWFTGFFILTWNMTTMEVGHYLYIKNREKWGFGLLTKKTRLSASLVESKKRSKLGMIWSNHFLTFCLALYRLTTGKIEKEFLSCYWNLYGRSSWSKKFKLYFKNCNFCEYLKFGAISWKINILPITALFKFKSENSFAYYVTHITVVIFCTANFVFSKSNFI